MKRVKMISLAMTLCFGIFIVGCATNSQVKSLESQVLQALEKSEMALKEAQKDKGACDSSVCEKAAKRAEDEAVRAENAADRAEAMANKAESIFMKRMKK